MRYFIADLIDNNAVGRNIYGIKPHQIACVLCGRGVNPGQGISVAMYGDYEATDDPDECTHLETIGPDCYRRHADTLRPFAVTEENA